MNPLLTYGLWGICVLAMLLAAAIQGAAPQVTAPGRSEPQPAFDPISTGAGLTVAPPGSVHGQVSGRSTVNLSPTTEPAVRTVGA